MRAFGRSCIIGLSLACASLLRFCRRRQGKKGANLIGFFGAQSGLGQSVRSLSEALKETGLPSSRLVAAWHPSPNEASVPSRFDASLETSIVVLQPESLPTLAWKHPSVFRSPRLIAYWTWELAVVPKVFARWAKHFDEIWVPSAFVKDAMEKVAPEKVFVIPPPVRSLPDKQRSSSPMTFLCMADAYSVLERKNPLGVVDAFTQAFTPSDAVRLIIKCLNVDADPANVQRLRDRIGSNPQIELVTQPLSREETDSLLKSADVFVSLHRSEGFGIAIQEAMVMGAPVIATQWSGSADLMREEVSFPVSSRLVTLDAAQGVYEAGSKWAEPDIAEASRWMRFAYENRAEAQKKGALASEWIRKEFSTRRIAMLMQSRINVD